MNNDRRRRYSLETIRNLVTNEAHEYYANHGFPAGYFTSSSSSSNPPYPSGSSSIGYGNAGVTMLRSPSPSRIKRQVSGSSDGSDGGATGSNPTSPVNFMDEPVYDWEIAMSDEEEVEGEAGFGPEDEEEDEEDVDDDEDDDEDYEEYEDEEGDVAEQQQQQDGSVTPEVDAEHAADKENAMQEEVSAEAEEEERRKRHRRRRSSLLKLRKESGGGESEEGSSPDPEGPSSPGDDKTKSNADGEVDDAVMDVDIDLDIEDLDEALVDPNFNLELSSCASASASGSPTSPQQMSSPSSPSATSPSSGQSNGVFTAFYVPPVQIPVPQVFAPQPLPAQDSSSSALGGALGGTAGGEAATTTPGSSPSPDGTSSLLIDPGSAPSPPATPPPPAVQQVQLPLQTIQIPMHIPSPTPPPIVDLPPPRLSSVPVWALRNMEMLGGSMGKGTPINRDRADEWARAWSSVKGPSTMARSLSADGSAAPAENATSDSSKREADFRMEVDSAEGGGRREGEMKPVLRLSLPGDDLDVSTASGNAAASNQIQPQGAAGPADSNPASSSCKQSMLVDTAFEPQNQAAWDAFLASLGDPLTTAPSASSSSGIQQTAQQGMVVHDIRGAPPPYSSLHPPHSPPPPTPTPPSPASSTCSLSQESSGSPGSPGPSVTIHSPGTSANNGGMMNPMFGMMNVNMMFGVPGAQGGGGNGGYAPHQGAQMQQQLMPQQQQQGVSEGSGANGQQCFPAMGLTMSMPPPGPAAAMGMTASMGGPSFNNGPSFNSMPSFNMGMGLGMNPATMNMNVPLNMGMGMPMPMSMQMPMSMPFAGLQLGLTLSLAPQQHSAQQQQQNQGQLQWSQGGSVVQGNGGQVPGVDFDLASLGVPGNGMGIGPGGEGMNMFSLVNASTPANTPLNSPLSPSSSSIPSSMLGVLGSGSPSAPKDNEKGPGGMGGGGAGATPSTLSYALG
ncbi:hypothetical protein H1R20_g2968, partial [Candolleomyces eurysporus]